MARTVLLPDEEIAFQAWYQDWATRAGIDPDPDNPEHQYDYRGAYKAGAEPAIDPSDNRYHWPSEFKDDTHPNRFVNGVDTKRGQRMTPRAAPTPAPRTPRNPAMPSPQTTAPGKALTPGVGDLIPLQKYLQQRRTQPHFVDDMVRAGAKAIIPKLQGPAEIPKGQRVVPKTMTDAQSVGEQNRQKLEEAAPYYSGTGPGVPRPLEVETPREQGTRSEVDRIMDLLDEIVPEAPGG